MKQNCSTPCTRKLYIMFRFEVGVIHFDKRGKFYCETDLQINEEKLSSASCVYTLLHQKLSEYFQFKYNLG